MDTRRIPWSSRIAREDNAGSPPREHCCCVPGQGRVGCERVCGTMRVERGVVWRRCGAANGCRESERWVPRLELRGGVVWYWSSVSGQCPSKPPITVFQAQPIIRQLPVVNREHRKLFFASENRKIRYYRGARVLPRCRAGPCKREAKRSSPAGGGPRSSFPEKMRQQNWNGSRINWKDVSPIDSLRIFRAVALGTVTRCENIIASHHRRSLMLSAESTDRNGTRESLSRGAPLEWVLHSFVITIPTFFPQRVISFFPPWLPLPDFTVCVITHLRHFSGSPLDRRGVRRCFRTHARFHRWTDLPINANSLILSSPSFCSGNKWEAIKLCENSFAYCWWNTFFLKSIRCQSVLLILPVPGFSMDILSLHGQIPLIPCQDTFEIATPNMNS